MIEGGCETNRVTRIFWRLYRCSCHIVVTCCNLELIFRMVTNSIQPLNLMYAPRQWLLLPYINMDPSTQEGYRRLPHIHASKAPLIVHTLLGGRCLPTWCATGSSCLVYKFLRGGMADRRCRRMGGEAVATNEIERLVAPTPRITGQARHHDASVQHGSL